MSEESIKAHEIRQTLDDDLNVENLSDHPEGVTAGSLEFFQQLFVESLNFDVVTDPAGRTPYGEEISTEDWSQSSRAEQAYILAEAYDFRIVYIELEKLTRTAQRHAVTSMKAQGWAREGEFIAVFHDSESEVWHLVSPYVEEGQELGDGQTVLRRYIIGEGETHRTVSGNLAKMDASRPSPLYERIQDAFRLQPVTEKFYGHYKEVRDEIDSHLRDQGLEIEQSKRYSHLLLNRLMFLYFLQKKGWLRDEKRFMRTFLEEYESSEDEGCFHEKWLDSLFFEAMNQPPGEDIEGDFPEKTEEMLESIPFLNGGLFEGDKVDDLVEEKDAYLPDDLITGQVIRNFLESYNFTVTEESPYDLDVAVDPAMLGKIYESLIAEEERDEAGIFYTPRVEVDLMVRLSLYDHLITESNDPGDEGRERIINFLFTPLEEWEEEEQGDVEPLLELIHAVDIVDPACGSGAFLVGMMQVIFELYRKLGIEPDYELKEQIVNENIHGVDIKDWAVRVAEFRLWLSLVEAEDEVPDAEPVLPNFRFKLHVGDSIVQKNGSEFISLDEISRNATGEIEDQLEELEELKNRYFEGESELKDRIEEEQRELLRDHIQSRIDDLEEKKDKAGQRDLEGNLTEEAEKEIEEIEAEIEELEETKENLDKADEEGLFLWDMDFPEVMLEGGFDIVIGNPPYVRQESIIQQDIDPERLEMYSDDKVDRLKDEYKEDLRSYVREEFGIEPGKRSDLYLYFFFKGIELLNENGRMMYICSNSWLDIGYGKTLQEGLLSKSNLKYILGNRAAKTFEDSDVNTVITLAGKNPESAEKTEFVAFDRPFINYQYQEDLRPVLLDSEKENTQEIELDNENLELYTGDGFRTIEIGVDSLWRLGDGSTKEIEKETDDPERVYSEKTGITGSQTSVGGFSTSENAGVQLVGDYDRGKWGKYIDAPELYFQLWREYSEKFTYIRDLSDRLELARGTTSGANKFFFVPRPGQENRTFSSSVEEKTGKLVLDHKDTGEKFKIEKEYWMRDIDSVPESYHSDFDYIYESGNNSYVPNLILVKNREIKTSPIQPSHLNSVHIQIDDPKSELEGKDVKDYVELGERPIWGRTGKPLPERPTLSGTPWYSQSKCDNPFILLNRTFNANFQFHYNPCKFEIADNFFYLPEPESLSPGYMAGYMNSTFGWFMIEITARQWTNTLRMDKYEYRIFPLLSEISEQKQSKVEDRLEALMERDIGHVFDELGAYSPEEFTIDGMDKTRYELDKLLFEEVGIEDEEKQEEFYREMIKMVRDRLMRQPDENPSLCEEIAEHNPQYDYSR